MAGSIAVVAVLVALVAYAAGASGAGHRQLRSAGALMSGGSLVHPRWRVWPRSPLGRLFGATVVWDGHEALEIGGVRAGSQQTASYAAAAFDPMRRSWRRLPNLPADVAPFNSAAAWAGDQLIVVGGQPQAGGTGRCCVAGLLDPTRDHWSTVRVPVDPLPQPAVVWTGRQVMVSGVTQNSHPRLEAAVLDPTTRHWTRLDPPLPSTHTPQAVAMVATHNSVVLWSLWSRTRQTGPRSDEIFSGIDVLRLSDGHWRDVTGRWPQHETVSSPSFTGTRIVLPPGQIWCGTCSHPAPFDENGYLVNPNTLALTAIPHGPLDDLDPAVIWTGTDQISLNEGGEIVGRSEHVLPGDVAIWNPSAHRWTREPRAPQLPDTLPVWDGTDLLALTTGGHVLAFGQ